MAHLELHFNFCHSSRINSRIRPQKSKTHLELTNTLWHCWTKKLKNKIWEKRRSIIQTTSKKAIFLQLFCWWHLCTTIANSPHRYICFFLGFFAFSLFVFCLPVPNAARRLITHNFASKVHWEKGTASYNQEIYFNFYI